VLRDALKQDARSGAAHHALGLLLVRQKRMAEALPELEAAARLVPERARYGYGHAVALSETGQPKQAIEVLERVLARHPYDRDTLSALVAYAREQGRPRQALVMRGGWPISSPRMPSCASSSSGSKPTPCAESASPPSLRVVGDLGRPRATC
jgi:tetratricopeptide (TPR) repeat protein